MENTVGPGSQIMWKSTDPHPCQHASKLPRAGQSRLPSPTKHAPFGEMTASTMNARSGEMLPPPSYPVTGMKRKTLAERAGEPHRKPQAPVVSKQANYGIKATTLAGSYRQPSSSSSVASSRPSSVASSRNVSNGSYTSSISTGSRPPSVQAHRPQSAMAGSRIQRPSFAQGRPASSMETHDFGPGPATGRSQCRSSGRDPYFPNLNTCSETLEVSEGYASSDTQPQLPLGRVSSIPQGQSQRNASLSTALDHLSLSDSRPGCDPEVAPKREVSLTTAMGNMSLIKWEHAQEAVPPNLTTPSHIPKPMPRAIPSTPVPSPVKTPKKTPAPNVRFMNRYTNMPFEVFDSDDRLMNMENMMSDFQKTLSGATTESNGLKETIAVLKARGLPLFPCSRTFADSDLKLRNLTR